MTQIEIQEIKLLLKTFSQKQTSLITGMSTSAICRVSKGQTQIARETSIATKIERFKDEAGVITHLLGNIGIVGAGNMKDIDFQYIALLKRCGSPKEPVRLWYQDICPPDFRYAWNNAGKVDLSDFDYSVLKLSDFEKQILKGMMDR